jgi:glycosyltransferase involved in cell wall biosynthesis
MSFPLISIIIPTYNREFLIERAIQSVINQTYPNWELVIVDDGSTDTTWDVLLSNLLPWKQTLVSFGRFQKTIQVYQIEHRGVSSARNFGIERSSGEWICFLDSDDKWYPEKLSIQFEFHKENPEYFFSQTNEFWNKKGNLLKPQGKHKKLTGIYLQESLSLCMVTNSSFMAQREAWNQVGGFREELLVCEDYDLWNRIFLAGASIGLVEGYLMVRYGGHNDQLSMLYPAMERFRLYSLLLTKQEFISRNAWIHLSAEARREWDQAIENRFSTLIAGRKKRGEDASDLNYLLEQYTHFLPISSSELKELLSDKYSF